MKTQSTETSAKAPKHTPGKLVVTGHTADCDDTGMSCAWVADEDCTVSIEIKAKNDYGTVQQLGHLIAAAPELLAALIHAEAQMREVFAEAHRLNVAANETVFNPAVFQLLRESRNLAAAASAKAEGRE